jgi:spore coat polysaccharide biosynthesis predicted glycosyltransferase SpsG
MNRGVILLRVDGSAETGMGRIARCLALANALQRRRYQMTFISHLDNQGWPDRIRRFRHNVLKTPHLAGSPEDRAELFQEIQRRNAVVVVTDSPHIDEEYLAMLSTRVPLVISLDESARIRFPSDLVLNPTLGHGLEEFSLYPGTQLVSGNKYAMIRAEFRRARNVRATEPGGPARVLISLGGGQVGAETARYAKALLANTRIEKIDAVVGPGPKEKEKLEGLLEQYPERLHVIADARDLGTRMTKAHLLITGAGNTALEASCVGMPMILISRNEYQELNALRLEEIGVGQYVGPSAKVDPGALAETAVSILEDNFERKAMSRTGRMLIDGRGADRIVTATEILLRRSRRVKTLAAA